MPRAPQTLLQERTGILAVATEVNRMGLIWRETVMVDVGIDGQIEFVNEAGEAVGHLAAVQVKSGPSYFHDHGSEWRFYPDPKHRFHWERFPIPVLVFLHSPADGATYWVDARQALRSPGRASSAYLPVPKGNRLQDATREQLFATLGASSLPFLPLEDVLRKMVETTSGSASFPLSYFDLFANGLTNIARSVYHGVDLAVEVAEEILSTGDAEAGVGVGPREHDFLFAYVLFLVEQGLADVNVSDCLTHWYDQEMQPTFIAPLTSRGRALVRLIGDLQEEFESDGLLQGRGSLGVAQEDFVRMAFTPSHYARIPIIREFQRLVASRPPSPA
ncbi:MAG TPA: DUF4365 domain-containing protein [Longimicrobiaceae bacterium]|nr:DUF4365 domain-containing protein [Longimicrobiaceae bacterium]